MNFLQFKIALRYLKPSRKEGFISVIAGFSFLGITLGVAALIIVLSVMSGFREKLLDSILGFNGHVMVSSVSTKGLENYIHIADRIRQLPDVVSATPLIDRQAMLTSRGVAQGVMVHGIHYSDIQQRQLLTSHITQGSLQNFEQSNAVVLGQRLADKMHVDVGDTICLISPEGNASAFGTVPRMRRFTVAATFEVGMSQFDGNVIFIPLDAAQKFFRLPNAASHIEVFVKHPDQAQHVAQQMHPIMSEPVRILDWQKANSGYNTALQVERNVMFIILTLIIVVAAFNIISSMIMLVKEKSRDIAILKTLGATRGMIMQIFFLSGALIGVTGTVVGCLLGVGFAANIETIRRWIQKLSGTDLFNPEIYFLSQLPAKLNMHEVITVVCTSLVLVIIATLIPSLRAARLDPVEALRYE